MTKTEIEKQKDFIIKNSHNGYIDKNLLCELLSISTKTAERRLKDTGIMHMSNTLISMMKDIESGMPSVEVSNKYKCSLVNVNAFARRHNIKNRYQYRHSGYKDPYYFDDIDSSDKAYILGFIAADGCVTDKEIRISLSSVDSEILEKIRDKIGFDNKVKFRTCTGSYKKESSIACVSFGTREMIVALKNLGFNSNKTIDFKMPDISDEFKIDFFRGFVDGDGSFTKYVSNDGYTRYCFSLCGTYDFLIEFRDYFSKFGIKFNSTIRKRFDTENCCYTLSCSGRDNTLTLLDIIYGDIYDKLFLQRKYDKYINLKM